LGSAAGSVDLEVAESGQEQSTDGPILTQVHSLTVQSSSQSQVTESLTLAQVYQLSVDSTVQSQATLIATLTQVHELEVFDSSQAMTSTNVTWQGTVQVVTGNNLTARTIRRISRAVTITENRLSAVTEE